MSKLIEKFERLQAMKTSLESRRGTKLPICILVDTSGSMNEHDNIGKLNEGLATYFEQMLADSTAVDHIEIAIISFGHNDVSLDVDFEDIRKQKLPVFTAGSATPMCGAIMMGLDLLEERMNMYQKVGITSHPPHMIIMTDGMPSITGVVENGYAVHLPKDHPEFLNTLSKFNYYKDNYNLVSITVAVGDGVQDPFFLQKFASKPTNVLKMDDTNIVEFFKLLSKSTSVLSRSVPNPNNSIEFEKTDDIIKAF